MLFEKLLASKNFALSDVCVFCYNGSYNGYIAHVL